MLKKLIKRNLELLASHYGRHRKSLPGSNLLIIGYHRILPDNHPEYHLMQAGMKVRPETLRMHVEILKKYFELVDLSDWVSRVKSGQSIPEKACAITFDDGWIDNYEYAFPVLKEQQVPATIFLVSSMIGTQKKFWPERIAEILLQLKNKNISEIDLMQRQWLESNGINLEQVGNLTSEQIDGFITRLKILPESKIYADLGLFSDFKTGSGIFEDRHVLTLEQIEEMKQSGLVRFASHTKNHFRLNKIDDVTLLNEEIEGAKAQLEKLLSEAVNGFCYPNGDYDEASLELVRMNYDYACTTRKGWNDKQHDLMQLNRVLVHEDISNNSISFEAKLSGWL